MRNNAKKLHACAQLARIKKAVFSFGGDMSKIKLFLTETFLGHLVPFLVLGVTIGVFFPLWVKLGSIVIVGVWLLCSVFACIRIPNDDDGGCLGALIVYFLYFVVTEIALWLSYAIMYIYKHGLPTIL